MSYSVWREAGRSPTTLIGHALCVWPREERSDELRKTVRSYTLHPSTTKQQSEYDAVPLYLSTSCPLVLSVLLYVLPESIMDWDVME